MRKRFNLTWRVITALLLLVALVPALVGGVAFAAKGDTTAPQLVSITWIDFIADGKIGPGDYLLFYWSESMASSLLDTMDEINQYLDSSACGAPPTSWDYGSNLATPQWDVAGTTLQVTLGTDCCTTLSGAYVTPKTAITDKAGNPVSSSQPAIIISPSPDTTTPSLVSAAWNDVNRNGLYDTGDFVTFYFSEAIRSTNMLTVSYDTLFQLPVGETYDSPVCAVPDFSLPAVVPPPSGACAVTIPVGAGAGTPAIVGGEAVTPLTTTINAIMDLKGNIVVNSSALLPKVADGTRPTLISITWIDMDYNGVAHIISPGDKLVFKFSESMDATVLNAGNIDAILNPAGHDYVQATGFAMSWDLSQTLLTVTLGGTGGATNIVGGEAVNPSDALLDRSQNNMDGTTAIVTIPTTPSTTPALETTRPWLNSSTWVDANANGKIDGTDLIRFNFNEAMDTTYLTDIGQVNVNLNTNAVGSTDYGSNTAGAAVLWWRGDTVLEVRLGTDCATDLGGQSVNPSDLVKDKAGNIDSTSSPSITIAPDTALPQLLSVTWLDGGAAYPVTNGIMDAGDYLYFNFNEQMSDILAANVNTWLDSTAPGLMDYGNPGPPAVFWMQPVVGEGNSRGQLRVTLAAGCSNVLMGQTINPDVLVTDAKGNPDGTLGMGPAIPLPPDKIAPYLNMIEWTDKDSNGILDRGDELLFYFSESVNPACIPNGAAANAVLDSTASGTSDYGTTPITDWSVDTTRLTIILDTNEQLDGGEMVNPTIALVDRNNNQDQTPGAGIMIPSLPGTAASLIVSPTSRTFTAEVNGSNPATQTVSITNGGTQTLSWTVSSPTKSWLSVTPTSGTNAGTLTLSVNTSGMSISTDSATFTVTGAGSTQTVTVTIVVTAPATPTPTSTPAATPTPTSAAATPTPTTSAATPTPTPSTTATPTPTPSTHGSGSVGTSGGTVTTTDGKVSVEFPSGAFASTTSVSITSSTCHGDTDAFVVGITCFSVTPSGDLDEPATICVKLSNYDKNIVDDESKLTLGYWSDGEWHQASHIEITDDTICGQTTHLSDWAVLGKTGEGWQWWYWALIGGGAFIVILAIILLIVLPKKGKGEEIPAEELYGEEEEEF